MQIGAAEHNIGCNRLGEAQLVDANAIACAEGVFVDQLVGGQTSVGVIAIQEPGGILHDVKIVALATIDGFTTKDVGTAGAWQENVMTTVAGEGVPATAAIENVIARTTIDGVVERTNCDSRFRIQGC